MVNLLGRGVKLHVQLNPQLHPKVYTRWRVIQMSADVEAKIRGYALLTKFKQTIAATDSKYLRELIPLCDAWWVQQGNASEETLICAAAFRELNDKLPNISNIYDTLAVSVGYSTGFWNILYGAAEDPTLQRFLQLFGA